MNRIGITVGDVAGIGTEIALKFLATDIAKNYDITLFADRFVIDRCYKEVLKSDIKADVKVVESGLPEEHYGYGTHSEYAGKLSIEYIRKAVDVAMRKEIDAIVTMPINKYSIKLAGCDFMGHTEFISHLTNAQNTSMMMVGGGLKIVLTTTHDSIKNLPNILTEKSILKAITNANKSGIYFGKLNPKIAVTGLNPHAGDNGALGDEEILVINPAIENAKKIGIDVSGAYPADTIYLDKQFDIFVAIYHDQALIPIKLLSFGKGVNVTLGLPFVRTSVDHGTAFNIAGQGVADIGSLIEAVKLADSMVNHEKPT